MLPGMVNVAALLHAARTVLEQSCARALPAVFADWPTADRLRPQQPSSLSVLGWLAQAARHALPGPHAVLAHAVAEATTGLTWRQTYPEHDVSDAFLERYGWSEICGLAGPVPSATLACGVLLLGPETHYPPHHHAAAELYVPLSGEAEWQCGVGDYVLRTPGSCIVHRPGESHAMRTFAAPLLALYLWSGEGLDRPAQLTA